MATTYDPNPPVRLGRPTAWSEPSPLKQRQVVYFMGKSERRLRIEARRAKRK